MLIVIYIDQGGDVALGLERIVRDVSTKGKTFELVGPHAYQMSELVDYMFKKAHCLPQFNFKFVSFSLFLIPLLSFSYRRHGLPDPYFMALTLATEMWGKFFKTKVPLNREWMQYVVSNLYPLEEKSQQIR